MVLYNGTFRELSGFYDGIRYVVPPRDFLEVPQDVGEHLSRKLRGVGLVEAKFGVDPEDLEYDSLTNGIRFLQRQIAAHNAINAEHDQTNKSPLPKSEAVLVAEKYLPIYKKQLEAVEAKRTEKKDKEFSKSIEDLSAKAPPTVDLSDMDIDRLRQEAESAGIQVDNRWSSKTLRKKISEATAPQE